MFRILYLLAILIKESGAAITWSWSILSPDPNPEVGTLIAE